MLIINTLCVCVCFTPDACFARLCSGDAGWLRIATHTCLIDRDLEADHSEKQGERQVFTLLKGLREGGETATSEKATDTVAALKSYVASLAGHLEREERALVVQWLNLTPELYTTYRTYLVGKYRLVY